MESIELMSEITQDQSYVRDDGNLPLGSGHGESRVMSAFPVLTRTRTDELKCVSFLAKIREEYYMCVFSFLF